MAKPEAPKIESLAAAVIAGERKALARAITLVESTRGADRERAERLLTTLLPRTGQSLRIAISGAPGAGKSTFIEALGRHATRDGTKLAVFAVDPSSRRSGGSILGDKTRMTKLARDHSAFVRATPSGFATGGMARHTREAILLAEAAGYERVFVESVGIGQSEAEAAEMVDIFVLLVAPGSGDDLQGVKRGVTELADLVIITKADGDLENAAACALADYRAALSLMRPRYPGLQTEIVKVSALAGAGIAEAWEWLDGRGSAMRANGILARLRAEQARSWFRSEVHALLAEELAADGEIAAEGASLEASVVAGQVLPGASARALVRAFRGLDGAKRRP